MLFSPYLTLYRRFNPRAREGRDSNDGSGNDRKCVSIHAPARGATKYCLILSMRIGFNPRAREGRDVVRGRVELPNCQFQSTRPRGARHSPLIRRIWLRLFQSTRPRGARLLPSFELSWICCFNPRAREGRDISGRASSKAANWVSIHAPARGATDDISRTMFTHDGFQSTRPRGARLVHLFVLVTLL